MSSSTGAVPTADPADGTAPARFTVKLTNFEGPFDLLLQLIGKHMLDVTEIALSTVTDEFIAHLRALGDQPDLDQASEFLVVASTLLDLKAARLLPAADVDDEEDLELLEARDLLFARLLQYRAYKLAASYLAELERAQALRRGRSVDLSPEFGEIMPEIDLGVDPQPGLALLWLAQGRSSAATAAVDRLLATPAGPVQRCRTLPGPSRCCWRRARSSARGPWPSSWSHWRRRSTSRSTWSRGTTRSPARVTRPRCTGTSAPVAGP